MSSSATKRGAIRAGRSRGPRASGSGEQHLDVSVANASLYGLYLTEVDNDMVEVGKSYRMELFTGGAVPFTCSAVIRHIGLRGLGLKSRDPCPLS
jgi:hypothetical protein